MLICSSVGNLVVENDYFFKYKNSKAFWFMIKLKPHMICFEHHVNVDNVNPVYCLMIFVIKNPVISCKLREGFAIIYPLVGCNDSPFTTHNAFNRLGERGVIFCVIKKFYPVSDFVYISELIVCEFKS